MQLYKCTLGDGLQVSIVIGRLTQANLNDAVDLPKLFKLLGYNLAAQHIQRGQKVICTQVIRKRFLSIRIALTACRKPPIQDGQRHCESGSNQIEQLIEFLVP